jgi:2-polyprenyl-6-methoxyphenol hydroxylase-like FAD-dependent oxidoreductase
MVVGGSLGGLFAANLLLRAGWDVTVYERVEGSLIGRGAGIVTHPELFGVLERIGVTVDATIGVEVAVRMTLDRHGHIVGERAMRQIMTSWGRLYSLLMDEFPAQRYLQGRALERVEQTGSSVAAHFADGSSASADLLVAADGIRSTVRAQFLPEAKPAYAGYVAWRGLAEEAAFSSATHAMLFERFVFCLPPHEQMLGYPVAGAGDDTRPGRRRYNFVWYRPADEQSELPRLCTDASGRVHEHSIPPPLIRPEVAAEMREAAHRLLAPQFAEVVDLAPQPFFQPIFDVESSQLAFGRVALLGDAGFVARPHVGMGVTKAAIDATVLVDALAESEDVASALARYEQDRRPEGAAIIARARQLGAYMQAQIRSAAEREMAERYRTPEAVMRDTAAPREAFLPV